MAATFMTRERRAKLKDAVPEPPLGRPKLQPHQLGPRPRGRSHPELDAPEPEFLQPRKSVGKQLLNFFCVSANPDDADYIPPRSVRVAPSRRTSAPLGRYPSSSSQRLNATKKCTHQRNVGMRPHANGVRTVYVPKYTSQGHSISTSRKTPRKKGRGVSATAPPTRKRTKPRWRRSMDTVVDVRNDSHSLGSVARDIATDQTREPLRSTPVRSLGPVVLQTASSRRPNPKLHRAHIRAVNDEWIKGYLPDNNQSVLHQPSSNSEHLLSRSSSRHLIKSSPATDSNNRTPGLTDPLTSGYVAPKTVLSTKLPLARQVIEEEQTRVETAEAYKECRRATKLAMHQKAKDKKMQAQKQQSIAMSLEETVRKEYKGQYLLEKVSLGLYRSEVRKAMYQLEKDGVLDSITGPKVKVQEKKGQLNAKPQRMDSVHLKRKAKKEKEGRRSRGLTMSAKTVNGA